MVSRRIARVYNFAGGVWYVGFRSVWNFIVADAEMVFTKGLRSVSHSKSRLLDLGCGTGANYSRLVDNGIPFATYTGVDVSTALLARARASYPSATFILGDVGEVSDAYNLVLSTWCFEHLSPAVRRKVLLRPGHHVHLYLSKHSYWFLFVLFAWFFRFQFVDDADLPGTKTCLGVITLLEHHVGKHL